MFLERASKRTLVIMMVVCRKDCPAGGSPKGPGLWQDLFLARSISTARGRVLHGITQFRYQTEHVTLYAQFPVSCRLLPKHDIWNTRRWSRKTDIEVHGASAVAQENASYLGMHADVQRLPCQQRTILFPRQTWIAIVPYYSRVCRGTSMWHRASRKTRIDLYQHN
jgi:hypothetical protein